MFTKDESNYLRGLLILAAIDQIITESERSFIRNTGKKLGFESKFCTDSLEGILENKYIDRTIPVFNDNNIAKSFVQDCYILALSDNYLCQEEIFWLNIAAMKNNIPNISIKGD